MMRSLPLARISTLWTPSGRRTSNGRRTAWLRLLKKTVPMATRAPDKAIYGDYVQHCSGCPLSAFRCFRCTLRHAGGRSTTGFGDKAFFFMAVAVCVEELL